MRKIKKKKTPKTIHLKLNLVVRNPLKRPNYPPRAEEYLIEHSNSHHSFLLFARSKAYTSMQQQDIKTYQYFVDNYSKWNISFFGFTNIKIRIGEDYLIELALSGLSALGFPSNISKDRFCKKIVYRVLSKALAEYMVNKI